MALLTPRLRAATWQFGFSLLERWKRPAADLLPKHLELGRIGEESAFFYLRGAGFTVIAQGWSSGRAPGDLDLVAWEGDTLCFIEVKTRSSRAVATAEAAVDRAKRRSLRRLAGHYMRQLPEGTLSRFDVLSIYLQSHKPARAAEFELFRDAFGWRETNSSNWSG